MNTQSNWKNWFLAGVTVGAIGLTALTFAPQASLAQSTGSTTTTPALPAFGQAGQTGAPTVPGVPMGSTTGDAAMRGRDGRGGPVDDNQPQLLADALGITVDELTAAQTAAQEAALAQAVEQGLITQEQADAILANAPDDGRLIGGRFLGHGAEGGIDGRQLLADALGITVDELEAAEETAFQAGLAQAVTDGTITQEQADLMTAQRAFREYADAQQQTAYAEELAAAVAAGAITQAQADLLSSGQGAFGHGGMRGGRGGHDFGGRP